MIKKTVLQLQPTLKQTVGLTGLYLDHQVHQLGANRKPFVYANFLTSIDGRIAVTNPVTRLSSTPSCLTSSEDFRLFQELQAQADCLITHSGYLRALANGQLGNILQVGLRDDAKDLSNWRMENNLSAQPDLVIASSSLDFTIPESLANHQQKVLIATDSKADPKRIQNWQQKGYSVTMNGDQMVDGGKLIAMLARRGYQSIYLIAGPQMLASMIRNQKLQRLYLTTNHQILGGEEFHTLIPDSVPLNNRQLTLYEHYYDAICSNGHSQFYSSYELSYKSTD